MPTKSNKSNSDESESVPVSTVDHSIQSDAHERSIAKMQVTHILTNQLYSLDVKGEFGVVHWRGAGARIRDNYAPQLRAGLPSALALMVFHRVLNSTGARMFESEQDLDYLLDKVDPSTLDQICAAIIKTDKDPNSDLYTASKESVEEQRKN